MASKKLKNNSKKKSISDKVCALAKKMENERHEELMNFYLDMQKLLMFPVESTLKDKIQIVLQPELKVSTGNWKGSEELQTDYEGSLEKIKPETIKKKVLDHLTKNAMNFAINILDAKKNSDGKTYTLCSNDPNIDKQMAFTISAYLQNIKNIGYALVIDVDKVKGGKEEKKGYEDLYEFAQKLIKKMSSNSSNLIRIKANTINLWKNIQQRLKKQKMEEREYLNSINGYYAATNMKNIMNNFDKLKKIHNQLTPAKMIPIFSKDDLEKIIDTLKVISDTNHFINLVKLHINGKNRKSDLHVDLFFNLMYIQSRVR